MEPFVIYLIKVNGLLIFFWIFYKLLLQKETFYTFNRFYFLSAVLIAFVLPLLSITKIEEIVIPASNFQSISTTAQLNKNVETKEMNVFENINALFIILSIVGFISIIKIGNRIYKINQLVRSIKKLEKHPTENIRITKDENMVYSFFKWIAISKSYLKHENYSVLIEHEKVHLKQKHTFDLLVFGFLQDLFWFNLIIHKMQKDVNLNLDYIVDAEITKQENSYQYQKTLLNYNQEIITPELTNAFNTSDLKKRILMLNAKKSNPMKKIKIALAAPALLAFFGLFQIETIAQVKTEVPKNDFGNNQIILETLQKDIKPIQEDKKLFNEIVEKYKTTVDGKEISKEDLKKYDNSKIKSVTVDFSNADKGTKVNFLTTGEEHERRFTFGILENINNNENSVDTKQTKNSFFYNEKEYSENKYDKILINGKEATEKELVAFYEKEKNASVKMNGRTIVVESLKPNQNRTQNLSNNNKPLYIVDDKEISEAEFRKISPNDIISINILKDEAITKKYGLKAKDGIILIYTNKKNQINDTTEKDIETVTSIFNDLKRDIKKLDDDDFKITKISSSIIQADGTKITVSEKY